MTNEIEYRTVTLPSQGVLYDDAIPNGEVKVRKIRARELASLAEGGAIMDRLEGLVNACSSLPNNFPQGDLLSADRMYLLLAIRTFTFGPEYRFEYRCDACGGNAHHAVNVGEDLDLKSGGLLEEDGTRTLQEPLLVRLPDMKCEVGLRYMRGKDEKAMLTHRKRTKAQGVATAEPAELYRYTRLLVTKDGEELDAVGARQLVDNLSALDLMALNKAMADAEPGVDLTVYPTCDTCGAENEISLPFTAEFFRPDAVY